MQPRATAPEVSSAHERILYTAYDLFCREGVQGVGVDRVIAEAGVAKMTLYRHFRSKQELVVAVLKLREQLWTFEWLLAEVERRADTPEQRLLALFDAFDDWFRREDYEACLFINTLFETHDRSSPVREAAADALANVRSIIRGLAVEAGVADPDAFAVTWQILLAGSIVQAAQGLPEAATLARSAAELVLRQQRAVA